MDNADCSVNLLSTNTRQEENLDTGSNVEYQNEEQEEELLGKMLRTGPFSGYVCPLSEGSKNLNQRGDGTTKTNDRERLGS